ncbi:Uncharacterized protein ALO50_05181 [Pseudomonas syringae pv. cerasicola]|uniref:Uncharacterized protein n=2 Tax=Pseudomonas syringae group TaxID=136849 RepID=A0A0P9MH13_PSESX|nr:Uncharacterized protein ALO50_05181 [Pseudomonas syringae pv. cerasicola]RMS77058.1 hypothetical protein ALP61_05642 [Pseudomonas savastanoi]RMS84667.1 hypothetical protein ALP60_102616 [Pseudomonas savastanoi]
MFDQAACCRCTLLQKICQEKPRHVEDWGSVFLAIGYAPHA